MALATGTRLGSYEVIAAIGAGGMGEVYRAHDSRLGRDVALKLLRFGGRLDRSGDRSARADRQYMATWPLFDPLRDHPQYPDLLSKMNLR